MFENLTEILEFISKKYNNDIALCSFEKNIQISYKELFEYVCDFGAFLQKNGLEQDDKVCLFVENSPYWIPMLHGIISAGGIAVPRQSSEPVEELCFIMKQSNSTILITDNINLINKFYETAKNAKFVLYIGKEKNDIPSDKNILLYNFSRTQKNYSLTKTKTSYDNTVCIIYTSGTSGNPKGVLFTQKSLIKNYTYNEEIKNKGTYISNMPLWHTGVWSFEFGLLHSGSKIIYTQYENTLSDIKKYKPDYVVFVPKMMNLFYEEYMKLLDKQPIIYNHIFNLFYKISSKKYLSKSNNIILDLLDYIAYKLLYKNFRKKIISDNIFISITGAIIDIKTELFFKIMRIKLSNKYGCTEANMPISSFISNKLSFGSVGKIRNFIKLKIQNIENDEIINKPYKKGKVLIKSDYQTTGYYKNPEATNILIRKDGYIDTGDIGYIDEKNNLYIIGRSDDIIVLNNGENIQPNPIEEKCKQSEFIKQIIIVGNGKAYLTAIVQPEYEKINLTNTEEMKNFLLDEINKISAQRTDFKWIERIRNLILINTDFSFENNCMTKNMKLKRYKIQEIFSEQIEKLYKQPPMI